MQLEILNEHIKDRLTEIISEEEKRTSKQRENQDSISTAEYQVCSNKQSRYSAVEEKKYFEAKLLFLKKKKRC